MKRLIRSAIIVIVVIASLSACRTHDSSSVIDATAASELHARAVRQLIDDPERAIASLTKTLERDPHFGPAHNTIGIIMLQQDRLYEAAQAFDAARRLLPGNPDPHVNLGLTFERAGRIDEAMRSYTEALEVHPEYPPGVQALARLCLRLDRATDAIDRHLGVISMRGTTAEWRAWARRQLAERSGR